MAKRGLPVALPDGGPDREVLRRQLLDWYRVARRAMPWRTHPEPYRTWVSEVMLQQTRVEAVREHYARFLDRFPDLATLAAAELEAVLAIWSGLGYYRRARLLHAGARYVVAAHDGNLPRERAALEAVPGIGRYTAGAILSIAYGKPEAVVDGNVERVFTRLWALPGDPRKGALKKQLWALAEALVQGADPGDLNQSVMELGALVCLPRNPACSSCPVATDCEGRKTEFPTRFPELAPRKKARAQALVAALVRRGPRLLFFRRGEHESLMPGLWELPTVEVLPGTNPREALAAAVLKRTGLEYQLGDAESTVRHGILDRRITLVAHAGTLKPRRGPERGQDWAFVAPEDAHTMGLSSMYAKVLKDLATRDAEPPPDR